MPRPQLSLVVPSAAPSVSRLSPRSPSRFLAPPAARSPNRAPGQSMISGFAGASSPISTGTSAAQQLSASSPNVARELDSLSPVVIEPASPPPLSNLNGMSFLGSNHRTSNLGNDYFINVTSLASPGNSTFDGHKIHFSVSQQQFEMAYSALGPLLFSSHSPIRRFKLTDMIRAGAVTPSSASARVTHGAQFTLYLQSSSANGNYDAKLLNAVRSFIEQCEKAMSDAGVEPGLVPASDVPLGKYASYRNENYERTAATSDMAEEKICALLRRGKKDSGSE
jgi:hypothetical protein